MAKIYPQHFGAVASITPTPSAIRQIPFVSMPDTGSAGPMDWTAETIIRLRELWDEGHSTAEIGRRLAVTKNAVVGKAHRLKLPARPSPIQRSATEGRQTPRPVPCRPAGPTLQSLTMTNPPGPGRVDPAAVRLPVRSVPPPPQFGVRLMACCWPIGEPGTPSFRFCGDAALAGKPYCADHASIAYVKVRERREDAA